MLVIAPSASQLQQTSYTDIILGGITDIKTTKQYTCSTYSPLLYSFSIMVLVVILIMVCADILLPIMPLIEVLVTAKLNFIEQLAISVHNNSIV